MEFQKDILIFSVPLKNDICYFICIFECRFPIALLFKVIFIIHVLFLSWLATFNLGGWQNRSIYRVQHVYKRKSSWNYAMKLGILFSYGHSQQTLSSDPQVILMHAVLNYSHLTFHPWHCWSLIFAYHESRFGCKDQHPQSLTDCFQLNPIFKFMLSPQPKLMGNVQLHLQGDLIFPRSLQSSSLAF